MQHGVRPGTIVGVYVERSFDLIVSLLAILKAGGAYLPLDLHYPLERLQYMMQDAQASVLVTQKKLGNDLSSESVKSVYLDSDSAQYTKCSAANLNDEAKSEDLAYVIYTSGSTGNPKGVAMPHLPLVNLLDWQSSDLSLPQARTLQFTPVSFDVSFQEIFSTLSTGGTLILIKDVTRRNPEALLEIIDRESVERLFLPFVALQHMAEVAISNKHVPESLKEVITAGEQLKITRSIAQLFSQLEHCSLYNHYGPSESHVVTSYKLMGSPREWPHLPPIGKPIDNAEIYLLDPSLRRQDDCPQLVSEGEVGELTIGGISLAQGYLNQPDLTNKKFISNPFSNEPGAKLYRTGDLVRLHADGNLEFVDRIDNLVKIRGYRVELGEIEAALTQSLGIKDAVVVARENSVGSKELAAYIVASKAASQSEDALRVNCRKYLKERLPEYMVPSVFTIIEDMPLTPSGKVDRRKLPEPDYNRPVSGDNFVAPQTEDEIKLSNICSKVLGIQDIGIRDNFFDIGGDSLKAIQLIQLIRENYEVDPPMSLVFENPTIEKLVKAIVKEFSGNSSFSDAALDLESEIRLDQTISQSLLLARRHQNTQIHNIFLTGATGYLGSFLLAELLQNTQADIYCLIRNKDNACQSRIQNTLISYGVWNPDWQRRIYPVKGELGKVKLGMSSELFNDLSEKVDVIYHCGAWVNMMHSYSTLKAANVLGTQEVLRLASNIRMKPVHYISTVDVYSVGEGSLDRVITEESPIGPGHLLPDGYSQSKYVAEQLVSVAAARNLPVTIYRPSNIMGHSEKGTYPLNSLISILIKGCIQLGSAPELDAALNLIPVDYVTEVIARLSLNKQTDGQVFNIVNPRSVSWTELIEWLKDVGYNITLSTHEDWILALEKQRDQGADNILIPLISLLKQKKLVRKALGALQVRDDKLSSWMTAWSISCPTLSYETLSEYLEYLFRSGFLSQPVTECSGNQDLPDFSGYEIALAVAQQYWHKRMGVI